MDIVFSVIVPVYKIPEELLENSLNSLIKQNYDSVEFIIVDDGSPDNCGEICERIASTDERMRVIHTENLGVSNARNIGLENAKGKYIIFVDGDDYVSPDLCSKCAEAINNQPVDILFFLHNTTKNPQLAVAEDLSTRMMSKEEIDVAKLAVVASNECFDGFWIGPPWGKIYRRDIISRNNIRFVFGLKKCQDRVFVFDYLQHVSTALVYNYCGYHYVSNEDSVCHKYNKNIINILDKVEEEFSLRVAEIYGDTIQANQAIYKMNKCFLCDCLVLDIMNKENKRAFNARVKSLKELISKEKYRNVLERKDFFDMGLKKGSTLWLIRMKLYRLALLWGRFILYI